MNETKLHSFVGQVIADMAASMSGVMTNIGHKLGLYQAMAGAGPMTAMELGLKTGVRQRYILEWLNNQAAGGYVTYDAVNDTYELPEEHAMVLANPTSPVFMVPGFDVISAIWLDEDKVAEAFRTGNGIGWHEHHPRLFCGTEAFFRTGYRTFLTTEWIPALEGVEEKLKAGIKVADVGCGHGASTIIMAQMYPNSTFWGFDYHAGSIEVARQRAEEAGVADRVKFTVAHAHNFPGSEYALVCFMDCLHDMGDPVGALKHAKEVLVDDGTVLLVEPFAGNDIAENLNPVGRLFYAASSAFCTPNSLSQEVGLGLGAQAGEKRLGQVMVQAGFSQFRRATQTPFNLILEARI
ncbi:class I SAM-dependent methyltransferase [Tolypothrix sp. FACHB-123]|uniref:class I SAM-dependent methyltransferase n=1 Tax=Tolypothrix sp. FACHB-123 TaxID=2692868 RepID=UPI0016890D08|nr:class I SAM-dependent methyltransferase [Tolypothrix sp. FACHB-123]MBD2353565.1 class I SAM-dependent methyltransferase [Tolypothrix sp. FACHB-123]